MCWIFRVNGRPVIIQPFPHSQLGLSLQPGKRAGTCRLSICSGAGPQGSALHIDVSVLASDRVWGKGHTHTTPIAEQMQQSGDFKQGGLVPAAVTPAVTVVCFLLLVNFRHAGGGRGPRQRLPGGQHQCQKHSGSARKPVPQCGWAQEGPRADSCLGNSCTAVGRAQSREAGKQVSEFQLCHFPAV